MIRHRSGGSGAVTTRSRAAGNVIIKELPAAGHVDRRASEPPASAMHIQEGRAAVSQLLDGDAVASEAGWNCVTFDAGEVSRVLWVSRNVAASMHDALWIARRQGVLASKLAEMQPLQAKIAHLTTLARPEPQN